MQQFTEIQKDMQIIEDFFVDETIEKSSFTSLCNKIDISETDWLSIKNKEVSPTKQQLENIYNFAYNKGLYLNEITWQECLDEYRRQSVKVCTHGSRTNLHGEIRLDVNGESNDFSNGFYLGQDISQAGMFVGEEPNSSLYIATFNTKGLKCAYFDVGVDWMIAVGYFRDKLIGYENNKLVQKIKDKVDNCDFVFAPIADNKIFEVIDAFLDGEITDLQCLYGMSATHLGYQYVLKSEKCLDQLEIIKHLYYCAVEKSLYNKESDIESNTSMNKALISRKRYSGEGKFINELLGGKE